MENYVLLVYLILQGAGFAMVLPRTGRSRWWALLWAFLGPIGLLWLGLREWPIEHEISWRRLQDGEQTEDDMARVEERAIYHELRGDSEKARAMFAELERQAPNPTSQQYYQNCLDRLDENTSAARPL